MLYLTLPNRGGDVTSGQSLFDLVSPTVSSFMTYRTDAARHIGRRPALVSGVSKARLVITAVVVEGRQIREVPGAYGVALLDL